MEELSLMDYLSVFKRRKKLFFITAACLFLLALVFALRWSNYRSFATVEVALPEVSADATNTTGKETSRETLADMRISYLQQKVLSTGSLVEVITKFNLFPALRNRTPMAEIALKMRKKIKLDLISGALANPASAQKATADQLSAIAFNLSFDYSDPLIAQQVTNELVSRFLDEDIKTRRGQAKETTAFLDAQIKSLQESLAEQEKKIAELRTTYGETRPDALAFNQQAATTLMMNLQNIESQLTTSVGNQGALRAQLAAVDPYSRIVADGQLLTTPSIQLRALKSDYATLTAKYGPEHPDVIKVGRQIASMQKQHGNQGDAGILRALINDAKTNLETVQKTKGPENPDVLELQSRIKSLEGQLKSSGKGESANSLIKNDADNPAYLAIVAQLRAAEEQGAALQSQKETMQQQLERYQKAIVQNPEAEKQLASLSRDYENGQLRYRQLTAQKMASEMSQTIEESRVGQRLVIINPPELPLSTQPSRIVFILGGFVLSLLGGAGAVFGTQLLSQCVVGPTHLESIVGAAPLVVIPHFTTEAEKTRLTRQQINAALLSVAALIVGAIVFSFTVMPLDVFFSVVALKLGL